jgi:hypothetical protein
MSALNNTFIKIIQGDKQRTVQKPLASTEYVRGATGAEHMSRAVALEQRKRRQQEDLMLFPRMIHEGRKEQ